MDKSDFITTILADWRGGKNCFTFSLNIPIVYCFMTRKDPFKKLDMHASKRYQFCSEVGKSDSVELFTFGENAYASCRWVGETDTRNHCLTKEVFDACPLTCKDCCGDVSFSFEVSDYGNLTCDASESFCFVSGKFRQNCPIKCNACDNPWDLRKLSEETESNVKKDTEVDFEVGEGSSSVASHDLPCSPLVIITEASVIPTYRLNPLNNNQEAEPKILGIGEISAILVGPLFLCGIILYLISKRENKISNQENQERFGNENDTSNGESEPDVDIRNKTYCHQTAITQAPSFIDADSSNLAKISSLMNVHNCGMYPCYSCSKKKMTKFVQVGKINHFPQIENVNDTGSRPFVSMDIGNSLDCSTDEYSACAFENQTSSNYETDEEFSTVIL